MESGHGVHESNVAGRGGEGNIGTGPGHFDTSGGHDQTDMLGRGGAGNMSATGTYGDPHSVHKVTVTDKVIGQSHLLFQAH
jgi:hypothetical protein